MMESATGAVVVTAGQGNSGAGSGGGSSVGSVGPDDIQPNDPGWVTVFSSVPIAWPIRCWSLNFYFSCLVIATNQYSFHFFQPLSPYRWLCLRQNQNNNQACPAIAAEWQSSNFGTGIWLARWQVQRQGRTKWASHFLEWVSYNRLGFVTILVSKWQKSLKSTMGSRLSTHCAF